LPFEIAPPASLLLKKHNDVIVIRIVGRKIHNERALPVDPKRERRNECTFNTMCALRTEHLTHGHTGIAIRDIKAGEEHTSDYDTYHEATHFTREAR